MSVAPPPRLFGIPATRAPIVAMLRRGPTEWSHIGRWDVARGVYEPGAWIRANLYPQRCDVSPDGRWLCYFTLKMPGRWKAGSTYVAISRLPWLSALAAWGTCGTWTRGAHFVDDPSVWSVGDPDEGDATPCRRKFGLVATRPASFAVERRRGWTETPDSPPRAANDMWDERRTVTMEKARPTRHGDVRLRVRGRFAAFREGQSKDVVYETATGDHISALDDAQWADWDADGRLLVATRNGRLQIRELSARGFRVVSETDAAAETPHPEAPPAEALRW
ncbi:MAG TPA: hypothetical protein VFQ62_18720 [Methylomirabilota bacterium]|nr:hypothetical protein [Methylomirabilota bacterium]